MPKPQHFLLQADVDPRHVAALVSEAVGSTDWQRTTVRRTLLDSADQRLRAAHLNLVHDLTGNTGYLNLDDDAGLSRLGPIAAGQPPSELADCHERRLYMALAPILVPRALVPMHSWDVEILSNPLRNEDDKLIGEFLVERHLVAQTCLGITLSAWAQRGYQRELDALVQSLPGEMRGRRLPVTVNAWMANELAPPAGALPTRIRPEIEGSQPVDVAVAAVLAHYQQLMRDNEAGTRDDIDVEFLHEFRVSMRKLRSVVSAFGNTLPGIVPVTAELAWLNRVSGRLRDLDVWISDLRTADTEPEARLLAYLFKLRGKELAATRKALRSKRYQQMHTAIDEWICAHRNGWHGQPLIRQVAGKAIRKRYRRFGEGLDRYVREPRYEVLHEFRKDGKKLRYLLDACSSFLPRKTSRALVADLKDLQTTVGTLCDRHARSLLIDECLTQVSDPRLRSVLEAEAVRYAPADLAALAPRTRQRLERSISRLGGKRGRRAVRDLCGRLK